MNQEKFSLPSLHDIGLIFVEHVHELAKLLNSEKFSLLQARKFAQYYARGLRNRTEFCMALNACDNLQQLKNICAQHFVEL